MKLFNKKEDKNPGNNNQVEPGDRFAMWISGMLVIGIPCLILVAVIMLVTLFLFGG